MKVNMSDYLAPDFKRSLLLKVIPAHNGAVLMHILLNRNCFAILLFNVNTVEAKVRILHLLGQKMMLVRLMLDKQSE